MDKEDMNRDQEINRKRKNSNPSSELDLFPYPVEKKEKDNDFLTLSLSFRQSSPPPTPTPPPLPPPLQLPSSHPIFIPPLLPYFQDPSSSRTAAIAPPGPPPPPPPPPTAAFTIPTPYHRPIRQRRKPSQTPCNGKSATVPTPFPWATPHRATVQSLNELLSKGVATISGKVQCKKCETHYEIEYDLEQNFIKVGTFIARYKSTMHERAPNVWMNPILPTCKHCQHENCVKPIIAEKKKSINWLFLLLGEMLGCCTLNQLKYFCKHTKNHRTGAKDRVLYLTYLGICKQLDPNGPFGR